MVFNKRTLTMITLSTAIGFVGDVATYSTGKGKFSIPRGKELITVLALGIIGGFIIDYGMNMIDNALKTKEEKLLDDLVSKEKSKIESGIIKNKIPEEIIWA